jgi:hypothetical protein
VLVVEGMSVYKVYVNMIVNMCNLLGLIMLALH